MMRFKSHVMITGDPCWKSAAEERRGWRTFILPIFFPLRAVIRGLLIGVTGVYVGHQNGELIRMPIEEDGRTHKET